MKLFFIQHKDTKLYFPEPGGRNGRGGSFTEANDKGNNARIFRTKLGAKRFLGQWVRGEHHHESGSGQTYDGDYDYWEDIIIKPVSSRNLNDYEIIEKEIIL